jgi:UDP-N-acetylmuramoyl-L-alanyl-D-glutamate--2,6-diaminopimelate ligase
VIGVTGTDGKTTTANLIFQILLQAGCRSGIISTVNATIGGEIVDTGYHVTTPEAPEVQRYLARMVAAGLTHVVLETTSHGLAQHRVTACEFDVAVVTNITHEHLDYHGSYAAYTEAKGRLFSGLGLTSPKSQGNPRAAVLNTDDVSFSYLESVSPGPKIGYSLASTAAVVYARDIHQSPSGLYFMVEGPGFSIPIRSSLVGLFNVSNCLAAISATVVALGMPPEAAQTGIAAMTGVPGRMERIDVGQDFSAIVDFAHTPNALKVALETVKEITRQADPSRRVIAVFGSAGLRDAMKRRMMAEVSASLADLTILTAEDPRIEPLDQILADMALGAESQHGVEGQTFWRIPDRGEAIRFAVRQARPGDVVIACGKGHEQSMAFGAKEYAWDDRVAMRAALAERLGLAGPAMPFLPTQGLI